MPFRKKWMVGQTKILRERPWRKIHSPEKILIIRFHALGDVAITMPYCCSLADSLPESTIHFLTFDTNADLPRIISPIQKTLTLHDPKSTWQRLSSAIRFGIAATTENYDVIIDLQGNWMSRVIRRLALPKAWSEFDRYSHKAAGIRTSETIFRAGLPIATKKFHIHLHENILREAAATLQGLGWDRRTRLVVLNPGGLFSSRNWPIQNYAELAKIWQRRERVLFLGLGTDRVREKNDQLKENLGETFINLTGKTSLQQALGILQYCHCVVSEDSGLMHMAWVSGIPTLALFGSTLSYWATPLGEHTDPLTSSDLECGDCGLTVCKWGDVRCLTRYSPEFVAARAIQLAHLSEQKTL